MSVPAKGHQTISLGVLAPKRAGGGVVSYAAFLLTPEKEGSGVHIHVSASGHTVFEDRRLKVFDEANEWVDAGPGGVEVTMRIENRDGKVKDHAVRVGWAVVDGDLFLEAKEKVDKEAVGPVESRVSEVTAAEKEPDEIDVLAKLVKNVLV